MSLGGFLMSRTLKKPKTPQLPPPPPPAPTIDEAAMRDEQARKFARRRGRKATNFGGGSITPSVAVKQLLG